MSSLAILIATQLVIAVAVADRRVSSPDIDSSPKKSPIVSNVTVASFPFLEMTESFARPL
jgi:hypothetical protein